MKAVRLVPLVALAITPAARAQLTPAQATAALGKNAAVQALLKADRGHAFVAARSNDHRGKLATVRFQHSYQKLEVVGSLALYHKSKRGERWSNKLASWQGTLDLKQAMPAAKAIAIARKKSPTPTGGHWRPVATLKILPDRTKQTARLVHWIELVSQLEGDTPADVNRHAGRLIAVDAVSGKVLLNYSKRRRATGGIAIDVRDGTTSVIRTKELSDSAEDADKLTKEQKKSCQVISLQKDSKGSPVYINPRRCDIVITAGKVSEQADDTAKRALSNSRTVTDYFAQKHSWKSYNDRGSKVVNVVHVGDRFDNAYWDEDGNFMAYGDGPSGRDYTLALDLAGHEFTHGIVAHTAKFIASGEPGALNEAIADCFGSVIARAQNQNEDWSMGSKLASDNSEEVALRSLSNPHKFKTNTTVRGKEVMVPFPAKYSERLAANAECDDDNDQCEVHANSTIFSHSFYRIASGFKTLAQSAREADDLAAQLLFATLSHKLGANDGFKETAADMIEVCADLFDDKKCDVVKEAFRATELL